MYWNSARLVLYVAFAFPLASGLPLTLRECVQQQTVGLKDQPSSVLAGGITLDSERQRLYAAFSCSSVIAFDISSPAKPTVWATRNLTGHMVFQVSLAPGNASTKAIYRCL